DHVAGKAAFLFGNRQGKIDRNALHLRLKGDKLFDVEHLAFAVLRIFLAGHAFAFLAADDAKSRPGEGDVARTRKAVEIALKVRDGDREDRGYQQLTERSANEMPRLILGGGSAALQACKLS